MSSKPKNHECILCDYKTYKLFNLDRHMVMKHNASKDIQIQQNNNQICQKDNPICQKDNPICQKDNPNVLKLLLPNQCDICEKNLSSKRNYLNHKEKCKGFINPLQCIYCNEVFTLGPAKYRHQKTCKVRIPSTDLTIPQGQGNTIIGTNTNNNIQTQNNIENLTQNNNIETQNNNVTLVIYNTDANKSDNFIKNHISHDELKNILKITNGDIDDEKKVTMVEEYMRNLLKNPDNRCIKKTNMRDIHSKIHTGDNNWITKTDKEIYPKLTCNIADGLSELIQIRNNEKSMIKTQKLRELIAFLDYMADNGYRNDEHEEINAQTNAFFRDLVQRIKSVIYDFTKIDL